MENEIANRLLTDLQDYDYRNIYDEGFLNSSIAMQIKILREQRGWSQVQLAQKVGMVQSRISEIEDVNYSSWSIRTLKRLARIFDLRLKVSFEEFGTLLTDFTKLDRESLVKRSFSDDPAFKATTDYVVTTGGGYPQTTANLQGFIQTNRAYTATYTAQGMTGGAFLNQRRIAMNPDRLLVNTIAANKPEAIAA